MSAGPNIHEEMLSQYGGIEGIDIGGWSVSDDQVMNLHGAEALGTRPLPPGLVRR